MFKALLSCVITIVAVCICSFAEEQPGQALPNFVAANERFGERLLEAVHLSSPPRNVVVSPVSLTLVFAALQANTDDGISHMEIGKAFGWGESPDLNSPARMLLAAFYPAEPCCSHDVLGVHYSEGMWITNRLFYRGHGTLSPRFIENAKNFFGVEFTSTGSRRPRSVDLHHDGETAFPKVRGENDVLVGSETHLQALWRGNTFSMSSPFNAEFRPESGDSRQVQMIESEQKMYAYAKTDSFEAVILPCNKAYMLAVLPLAGHSVAEIQHLLVETPGAIDSLLTSRIGTVSMPVFHFKYEGDYRPFIQAMGIQRAFQDLGSVVNIPHSHLTNVSQAVDIEVNRDGIRATAGTVVGGVYGGITMGRPDFHMQLNRPFLFLIRDHTTNALLFAGVVMDPAQH
jgi:serine protease inhibitor